MDFLKSIIHKPAIAFFVFIGFFGITLYLFTLPATSLRSFDWIQIPHFDKLVHSGIFFILFFLFAHFLRTVIKSALLITIASFVLLSIYAISIEFVQEKYIAGRSFEQLDIVADISGCLLYLLFLRGYTRKKIGPDRNRGRNQN